MAVNAIRTSLIGSIEHYIPGDDFKTYMERLTQFLIVNNVEDKLKVPLYITLMGLECYKILKSMTYPEEPAKKTFIELETVLTNHFTPQKNIIAEIFRLYKRDQQQVETISDYIVELKALAQQCEFKQFLDEALRDTLVCGLPDSQI